MEYSKRSEEVLDSSCMNEAPHGFLLIDKPAGITSHDVVDRLRKITGIKKIGHAGTLDPFAIGLLLMAIARPATREISTFVGLDKVYEATFVLGAATETLDPESEVVKAQETIEVTEDQIQEAMNALTGELEQIPPVYSAIKINGKKLYEHARKGEVVELKPRNVTVHSFELIGTPTNKDGLVYIETRIHCGSGTYVRALSRDLAEKLGTTGYVQTLRRTKIGDFSVDEALSLDSLTADVVFANLRDVSH